jgi:proteasome lid subunit RPN8/RPN11
MSLPTKLILTESQIDAIKREGEAAYPSECCGAILGRDVQITAEIQRHVVELEPLKNSFQADEQYHRFSLDPKELIDVEKRAGEAKLNVLGFYHSHPDHPARPSEYDRTHAWPFYSYVIVEIAKGKAAVMTSWQLDPGTEQFVSEEIAPEPERTAS